MDIYKLRVWLKELRAPFFTASVIPVLLGEAIAWSEGVFNLRFALLTLIAIICLNASVNTLNDFFDYQSGIDERTKRTPFSGGSGLLPDGVLKPKNVYFAGLLFLGVGSTIGLYLTLHGGGLILFFGAIGAATIYLYSKWLSSWGIGELIVSINLGPLAVLGAFYVQTLRITVKSLISSIPLGIMVAAILYINEFPDYDADRYASRNNLVVRMGKKKAVKGYVILLASSYASIIFGVLTQITSPLSLVTLITIPIALNAARGALKHYDDTALLIPTNAATIKLHLLMGVLLILAYVLSRLIL